MKYYWLKTLNRIVIRNTKVSYLKDFFSLERSIWNNGNLNLNQILDNFFTVDIKMINKFW